MDIPDPFASPFSIVHFFQQVFRATSCICTGLLYVGYSWSSRSTSLMSSSLLHQQCHACLIRLTWIVLGIGSKWPYSTCFDGGLQDLFNNARSILVKFPSSFFSIRLVSVHVVHPYWSIDTTWKKLHFIVIIDLEIRGRFKTFQTTALLRTVRILRKVLDTWGDLFSLKLMWKTILHFIDQAWLPYDRCPYLCLSCVDVCLTWWDTVS